MTLKTKPARNARSPRWATVESSSTADPDFGATGSPLATFQRRGCPESWMDVEGDLYSSPYVFLVVCPQPDAPTSSTVDLMPDLSRILRRGRSDDLDTLSARKQLQMIARTFSLSKAELARTLGVSRQAIYDWLSSQPMSPQSEDRVRRLAHLAWRFGGREKRILPRRPLTTPIGEGEPSILEMLARSPGDDRRLEVALEALLKKCDQDSSSRGSAASWLRSLGFRDPDSHERDANLEHNLLLGDLHRP